ncbi:hypothetical protein RIF29_39845 [Crotalaria pallida]|uniref:Uncharacterized protein n=1 Tax=Crotalaria pallida TaxID=3830 RepID=A0AAN9E2J9_CROPI
MPLTNSLERLRKLDLYDVALLYSNLLRIFSSLSPIHVSIPVLSMLTFTPGYLVRLWDVLEDAFFCGDIHISDNPTSENRKHKDFEKMQKQAHSVVNGPDDDILKEAGEISCTKSLA